MTDVACAWLGVAGFQLAIPSSIITLVGSGDPPTDSPLIRLEVVLAVDAVTGPLRFLRLQWADGEAIVVVFAGSLRFAVAAAGTVRPLGPFLGGLRDLIGARAIVATSDEEFAFLLDARALLAADRGGRER